MIIFTLIIFKLLFVPIFFSEIVSSIICMFFCCISSILNVSNIVFDSARNTWCSISLTLYKFCRFQSPVDRGCTCATHDLLCFINFLKV